MKCQPEHSEIKSSTRETERERKRERAETRSSMKMRMSAMPLSELERGDGRYPIKIAKIAKGSCSEQTASAAAAAGAV